jgi:hypothetical protein
MRAVIQGVKRASNSYSGNPTVRVITDQGTYLTKTDSFSGLVALGLDEGDVVELTITQGRIEYIDVVESQESTEEA